eukprot:gnl/TRDRNA2_/TRDRNA2_28543_c0_seq1.p1 gnl/TRDRNA2_/TRDRNA2_28543_c0~~gnl/TRDRNA2_/TRDRNA2_28543_c0_seq1.p1  ORF type:complete len:493 (+),score=41.55 gnl/TRDRNA2_/TRDRNA2_28543_c0_seq1:185-1480(+)
MSPVDVSATGEPDVDRWLASGTLQHLPAYAVCAYAAEGVGVFLDLFSVHNTRCILGALCYGNFDLCIMDDLPFRLSVCLLARAVGVPIITTTHTDVCGHPLYRLFLVRLTWYWHMASAHFATVHASVSNVFAKILRSRYYIPVHVIWPPVLWSEEFRRPPEDFQAAAVSERARWVAFLGFTPRAILLYAGRWSSEKRIHLLAKAVPEGCALVIVGDSDSEYADVVETMREKMVLPLRRMLNAKELRAAYAACDLVVSASRFETLGNVVVEAWCAGVPVAVQPAQGHLELVVEGQNSYFVDFDDTEGARRRLEKIIQAGPAQAVQPGLKDMGVHLRELDFPREVERIMLKPALAAAESWRNGCCRRLVWEPLLRLVCILAWLVFWLSTALPTRILFFISCEPRFELPAHPGAVLEIGSDKLGTASRTEPLLA